MATVSRVLRSIGNGLFAVADGLVRIANHLIGWSNDMAEKWNQENGVYDPPRSQPIRYEER